MKNKEKLHEAIEINGKFYVEKIQPERKRGYKPPAVIMAAMAIYGQYIDRELDKVRVLPPGVDIAKEYGLIELKQSKLSRRQRDEVVAIFNQKYEQI